MKVRDEDDTSLWLQTYTGLAFYPLAPHADVVSIEDIAHSLSMQCRFAGHTRDFYSVAQHTVLVSQKLASPWDALWGLLHDAAEAYLVDLPRPLKHHSRLGVEYRRIEERVMRAICERFRLPFNEPPGLKEVERRLLRTEQRDLLLPLRVPGLDRRDYVAPYPERITPLVQWQAELEFVLRFGELTAFREAERLRSSVPPATIAGAAGADGDGDSPPRTGGRALPGPAKERE